MSPDTEGLRKNAEKHLKEFVSSFQRPLERLWYAITGEKIKELKAEGVIKAFLKSLEIKDFLMKTGKAKIPIKELEQEPKKMASQLLSELRKIE